MSANRFTHGHLVVIEGIDGAGKTTQAKMLFEDLYRRDIKAVFSREPTDSEFGQRIRALAIKGRDSVTPEEEYNLFIEDRRLHVADLINPALEAGKVVILDRYYFSTMAYQGALGIDPQKIRTDNEAFCPTPQLAVFIDIPVKIGIDRIKTHRQGVPDLFEKESYLKRVARIFTSLDDTCIRRIDGTGDPQDIHRAIRESVDTLLDQSC